MKKKRLLWISVLLLMLTGCSSDDDNRNGDSKFIVGEWSASHHYKNPNSADTADMWDFTFNADGRVITTKTLILLILPICGILHSMPMELAQVILAQVPSDTSSKVIESLYGL